jgi:polyisoprenoid-binding protein YceI
MHASRQCSRYVVQPAATTLDFEAKSSLHPLHGKASQLTGFLDARREDGALALDPPPQMHVEFAVERLVSGNAMQDKEMWKLLDSKRHPVVRADLRDLRPSGGNRSEYAASGEITLYGHVRKYDGSLSIVCGGDDDDDDITVDGSLKVDIRDFGIKPPRFLMFSVQPVVNVRLHLIARLG